MQLRAVGEAMQRDGRLMSLVMLTIPQWTEASQLTLAQGVLRYWHPAPVDQPLRGGGPKVRQFGFVNCMEPHAEIFSVL